MSVKPLIACLSLTACLSAMVPLAQAQEATDKSVSSTFNGRELVVGDRAPDLYQREVSALHDWKKKGLKAPQEQSQWVQIKDQYVLVEITSGKILDMAPVKR